ncbi:MAG: ADP-ribosyltransferase, partial [Bacteroidia bacterium]
VVVVPALFLKFAYDKAFNQGIYDVAYTNISILGLLGVDELMLASKVLGKVPKMKSLIKWMWRERIVSKAGSFITTASKAITKTRLPSEFMEALKVMGKTEDEILDYFMKYHNDNSFRFLNEAEDLVTQFPAFTKAEAYTLWGYTTDNFYLQLNDWLRRGINTSQTQQLTSILQSALNKATKYSDGIAYRAIGFKPSEATELANFLAKHQKGGIVKYDEFVSCASTKEAAFYDKATKNVKIVIENLKPFADISPFADGIKFRGYVQKELLLEPGRSFEVLDCFELNGVHFIKLKEF